MSTDVLSYELGKIVKLIPGYDPYATAAPGEWFDGDAAETAIDFVQECCTLTQGKGLTWRAGQRFKLEPWQKAIFANLFGWKRADGTRRYRECLIYVPRKNGKSELAAALVCLMLFCRMLDDEPGAQLFSAAGKRDQTQYVFQPVTKMIEQDPELHGRATLYKYSITSGDKSYKAICAEGRTEHGGSTQFAVIDELHAQRTRELFDVLKTSTAARLQPLLAYLTTSDYEREGSICNTVHDYATKVISGTLEDSSFLPVIYQADDDDDWTDPETWKKANPNFGVTITEEYLTGQCKRAQEEPEFENEFKRLHLNIRTQQAFRWMPMHRWDACDAPIDTEALKGQPCHGGLDLASVQDMASLVLDFQIKDTHHLLPFYWCPEETAEIRERKDRQPYVTWSRQGLVMLTPGARIDYRYIRKCVNDLSTTYKIQQIGFDPWNATQITQELAEEDGFDMVEFRQGTVSMNAPMKQMMGLVIGRQIDHGGHKVLRWNMNNLAASKDPSDNVRPDKQHSFEKIDGAVAAIMAIGMATAGGSNVSPYETTNVRYLD